MCLSVVVALVAGYRYVIAVDRTWDGNCPTLICAGVSRTPLWTDGPNWGAGDIAPAPGDKLIFGASSFQFSTINTFAAGTSFDSMLYNGGAYAQSGNAVALTNGIIATGSGSATISLPISLNQNQTFAAETAGSGLMFSSGTISTGGRTLTIGGNGGVFLGSPITGTGGVNVQGTGQYTLAGNHPYTGDTQVTNAALTLACDCSASAFTLGNAVLRGAGTVKSLSSSGSSIEPGAAGNGTGIVSSTAGLQFVVGTLAVDLKGVTPGTQHDQLNVIGAVRLSSQFVPGFPALTVSLPAFTPAAGNTFVIVQNDGVDPVEGTFLSLPEGASFDVPNGSGGNTTFFITYRGGDGNDVVLNVPGTLTWTGAGAGSNSNWSNRANWSPSRLPISGERLVFPATGQSFSINDFPAGFVLRSITITGSHTLNGNAVQLTEGLLNNAPAGAGVNLGIGGSGAVTQSSDGLLVLSAANTFTGLVSVVQGTLRITHAGALGGGSAGTVVAAGATLQLSMPPASLDQIPESIQLTGMGVGGAGALEAIGANNAFWSGPVTLTATAAIGSSQPAAGFSLFGAISGTGGLTKVGNGVVDLAGSAANSYTGPTSINAGTLHLEKLAGTAVTSPLTIGDGVQESGAARSRLLAASANQLPPLGGTVVMNGGAMELTRESIASLSMSAESTIQRFGANAVLTLGGDVAMTGSNLIFVDRLVLGASVTFTTTGQTNQVFAQIDERGSASGLTKTGPGTMTLLVPSTSTTGSTYTGVTTVAAGTLELLDSRSLGAVSGGTVVNAGAALRVIASSAIHFEPLSINGSGIAGTGAVIAADTNTWSGTVTLGGDTVINTSTGTTVFTMSSIGGTGELQKTGPGELRIDGAGSSRPSRLRAGSLVIQFSPHLQPITIEAGTLLGFGTTGAITAEGAGAKAIAPGFSPGRLTAAGNVQLSATTAYLVELNGATAASQHDQLSVTGTVSLQDATLTVVPGFAVPLDQTFVIIANDGADPVIGTFAGLPEGAAPTFLGQRFQISYRGGDGNDVTLRRVSDTLPTIAITDVVVNEGNAGAANALFLVTLSAASSQQVTVQYATADGTATVAGGDYAARSGTLTFAPNETTATIAVPVTGDTTPEPDETFTVTLTSPVNALLGDAQATGRITNDEASTVPPTVSIDDVSIGEGDSVQVVASFTVRLSAPTGVAVSVPYATADGTAVAGQDYTAASGTVTLPAGSTSAPVLVTVLGDLTDELDETFAVNLGTPVNATLADGQAVGTIVNNDSPTAGPSMSIAPVSVAEGNTGTTSAVFAVTLSAPSAQVVSASFATSAETAVAPTDYPAQTGVVTFPPNTTAQTIVVSIVGDRVVEPDETFLVTLSNPVNAKIGDGQARGTIRNDDVRPTITIDGPASITATSPFLTIKGTASDDLGIASVTWTSNRGGGGAAEGTTSWTIRGIPLQKGVNVITVTADDIDGTVAAADLDPESVRLNTASATLTVTVNEFLYFLAEGATGAFFDEDIAIANPNAVAAPVSVTFLKEDGTTVPHTLTVPVTGRATIAVEQIAGLAATAVSAVVSSTDALPLVVERSMFWDQSYYGAHTGSAVDGARTKWLFGEGSQGFFDTFVLLANANPEPASVTVTFLTESGAPVPRVVTVGATSRLNVFTGAIPELVGKSFSIVVDSNRPIIAERAMYFGTPLFNGGHESAGVSEPSTSWFHAEGATGPFFDTFILVGNPNPAPATVTLTYLLDTGQVVTRTKTVAASSRLTVDVESEDPQLRDAAVSTTVTSTLPVISERAMYWPGTFTSWFEAHNSFGLTEVSTKWGLAEGRVGGPRAFETYILLANPNAATANVTVTYLKTDGTTVVKTHPVAPTSRFNVFVNGSVPELQNESFGAVIVSDLPIAVERALYNSSGGVFFAAGTNATAVKLP